MAVRRYIIALTLLFITIVTVWTSSNINWGRDRYTRIIKVDGNGYYAYLPAIFIYRDLHFGFFEEIAAREGYQNMNYEYRYEYRGNIVNKYFAGTALAQLPFFLAAHTYSWITGATMDGYSRPYLISINLASLFYLLISCIFLNKILAHYHISRKNRAISLIITVFGTNLFYYAVYEPSMSHVYSLAFISMFIYYILLYLEAHKIKYLYPSVLLLGVIILIRPVNLLIAGAIPFLAGDYNKLKEGILFTLKNWSRFILALLLLLLPILIQSLIYYLQTGSIWVYSYGEEKFYFDQPHIFKMLFSYRKGLFVYTPVLLFSLAGLVYLYNKNKFPALMWVAFFLILTYVLSCWHQWYYGGSFGSRVFLEFYALFSIPLGILLENTRKKVPRAVILSFISLLVIYSLIQTYQYYAGIIHWSDMTRELYWEKFLEF